jgi:hypothetical protein
MWVASCPLGRFFEQPTPVHEPSTIYLSLRNLFVHTRRQLNSPDEFCALGDIIRPCHPDQANTHTSLSSQYVSHLKRRGK